MFITNALSTSLSGLVLVGATLFTIQLDLKTPEGLRSLSCDGIPVSTGTPEQTSIMSYDLMTSTIYIAADCTILFRDGFED